MYAVCVCLHPNMLLSLHEGGASCCGMVAEGSRYAGLLHPELPCGSQCMCQYHEEGMVGISM